MATTAGLSSTRPNTCFLIGDIESMSHQKPSAHASLLRRGYATIRLMLLLGIVAYLAWEMASHWSDVQALSVRIDALMLFAAAMLGILAYQCLFGGWLILLWRIGCFDRQQLKFYSRVWWVSYLFRYLPGKVFLVIERVRMGSMVGIPPATGVAVALVETLLASFAAAWVSLLAVSYYVGQTQWTIIGLCIASIATFLMLPAGIRFICSLPVVRRKFPEMASLTLGWPDLLLAAPAFVLHFILLAGSFFLCLNLVKELAWTAFPGICGVYALSHLAGAVAMFSPGGLGVREGALSLQLSRVLPGGVAVTVAIGIRLWFVLLELLSLSLVLLLSPKLPEGAEAASGAVTES